MTANLTDFILSQQALQAAQNATLVNGEPESTRASVMRRIGKYKDVPITEMFPKRRLSQPRFKLTYETPGDLRLRLLNTCLWIGPELYYVRDCLSCENEHWLIVEDGTGQRLKVEYYSTPGIDLRTPDPQYIIVNETPVYFTRLPARQQQQGVTYSNCVLKPVGKNRFSHFDGVQQLIVSLKDADTLPWKVQYQELMCKMKAFRALRLSTDVAFFRDDNEKLTAEYRGRRLGAVEENCILVDQDDFEKPWIRNDLQSVGCELKKMS